MGRKRPDHSAAEFAEGALRPATVEELAAAERSAQPPTRNRARRPLIVGAATASVLLAGAGAVALSRADSQPTMVQPQGEAAPFGVGYVDGFGEHSVNPSEKTSPKPPGKGKPVPISPHVTPPDQPPFIVVASPPQTTGGGIVIEESELAAVYWVAAWRNSYDVYIWVHNSGTVATTWNVRLELPANATISATWATHRKAEPGNTWVFTPDAGETLEPGRTYLFAFEGTRASGSFNLQSCAVNGVACTKFG